MNEDGVVKIDDVLNKILSELHELRERVKKLESDMYRSNNSHPFAISP